MTNCDEANVEFLCQRCGNCCRWPGEVAVSGAEIARISRHLGMPEADFIETYTTLRRNRNGLTLVEKPNHECVFLDGIDCLIQAVKPDQCVGFPNRWRFPGWREVCEAIPVPLEEPSERGIPTGEAAVPGQTKSAAESLPRSLG